MRGTRVTPRSGLALVVALLLTWFIAPNGPAAYAESASTSLSIDYQTLTAGPGERVGLQGALAFGGRPAPAGVPVDITLEGEQVLATVPSGDGGKISGDFVIPDDLRPGERQLLAMVDGDDTHDPAVQGSTLEVTKKRAGTSLSARLPGPDPVNQGDQVTISGQVSRTDGKPAGIVTVSAVGGAEEESLASIDTDAQGRFQLSALVPTNAGEGDEFPNYPVRVMYSGSDDLADSEQALTLTLRQPPRPQVDDAPSAEPETAPPPAENPAPTPAADKQSVTLIPPWMIVVGLAGFVALIGAAMVAHRRRPDENARLLP